MAGAVEDDAVADRGVASDRAREPFVHVHHHVVLDVGVGAHYDPIELGSDDHPEHDHRVGTDLGVPVYVDTGRHEG